MFAKDDVHSYTLLSIGFQNEERRYHGCEEMHIKRYLSSSTPKYSQNRSRRSYANLQCI